MLQLPITLLHMNSLDILPHSITHVATALKEHTEQAESSKTALFAGGTGLVAEGLLQGSCDTQSNPQCKADGDLCEIGRILQSSPRRFQPARVADGRLASNPRTTDVKQSAVLKQQRLKAYHDPGGPTAAQPTNGMSAVLPSDFQVRSSKSKAEPQPILRMTSRQSSFASVELTPTFHFAKTAQPRRTHSRDSLRTKPGLIMSGPVVAKELDAQQRMNEDRTMTSRMIDTIHVTKSNSILRPFRKMRSLDRWRSRTDRPKEKQKPTDGSNWI